MSWMAVNNAPLLGTGATDISGLSEGFRDGQKLRQEYDARQQQKAMAEVMRQPDYESRITAAQQNKWAGVLVPALQESEYQRKIADQKYRAGEADILETQGKTSKVKNEAGKIIVDTAGQVIDNRGKNVDIMGKGNAQVAAASSGGSHELASQTIVDLYKQGVYTAEKAEQLLSMINPANTNYMDNLQALTKYDKDFATLYAPKQSTIDGGDQVYSTTYSPYGDGSTTTPESLVTKGQSAENFADNQSRERIATGNNATTVYGYDTQAETARRGQDITSETADKNRVENSALGWYKAETAADQGQQKIGISQQNADAGTQNANTNARKVAIQETQAKAIKSMKPAVREAYQKQRTALTTSTTQLEGLNKWEKELKDGTFKIGGWQNAKNVAGAKLGTNMVGQDVAKYGEFQAFLTGYVNNKMSLASGTQTDSDEYRFWKEVSGSKGVPKTQAQAIAVISRLRAAEKKHHQQTYENVRYTLNQYSTNKLPPYSELGRGGASKSQVVSSNTQQVGRSIFGGK